MQRIILIAIVVAAAAPADAFFGKIYHFFESRRESNNQWPAQYVEQDRINAAAPFEVMIRNGWRRQNLLGPHHFNEDCTALTRSGELRVQWILTQAPPEHRQLFIERSLKEDVTERRIATANDFAGKVVGEGNASPAIATHILSTGRPAVEVDAVNTLYRDNMMTPALPASSSSSSSDTSSN